MAVGSSNPAISYYNTINGDLEYVRATSINGTTWRAPVTVDADDITVCEDLSQPE